MIPDEERENFLILLAEWRGRAKHAIAIGKTWIAFVLAIVVLFITFSSKRR